MRHSSSALNDQAINEIRKLKQRPNQPFSIIAPSKSWITKNCVIDRQARAWINKLPGPYTLILKQKNKNAISKRTIPNTNMIGVRIPKHEISKLIKQSKTPFITTSVNVTGNKPLTQLKDTPTNFKNEVDYFIDLGTIQGKASTIIDLTEEKEKIIPRD